MCSSRRRIDHLENMFPLQSQSPRPSLVAMSQPTNFDGIKAALKAEVKAELWSELVAEFHEEIKKLRQEVRALRVFLRVSPDDDETVVQDAVSHSVDHCIEEDTSAEAKDYFTWRGFERCLQDRSVKIVKGSWLLALKDKGARVERRQELPEESFWTPEDALNEIRTRAETEQADQTESKFLFVLSYRWLQRGHPDPHCHHLTTVCKILSLAKAAFGDIGLFWDFLSLCQPDDDDARTLEERESFHRGLRAANLLYAHKLSVVLVQPVLPSTFTGPSYEWSGWCHFESVVSNLMKPWDQRLNVQLSWGDEKTYKDLRDNCKVSRRPPVSPATFKAQLAERVFTNGRTDADIVSKLYTSTWFSLTAATKELDFSNLLWSLPQAVLLSDALAQFSQVCFLNVSQNPFGTHGIVVLMSGVAKMSKLRSLTMRACRGVAVATNVPKWSIHLEQMKNLEVLDVRENAFDEAGFVTLVQHVHVKLKVDCSGIQLKSVGIDDRKMSVAGLTVQQLKYVGFNAQQLKETGFKAQQLKETGFTLPQLVDAGFSVEELRDGGYTVQQLKFAGFDDVRLREAGFNLELAGFAGFRKLLPMERFSVQDLKDAGFGAKPLKDTGFNLQQLVECGFGPEHLRGAGFKCDQLVDVGFDFQQLKEGGFRAKEFKDAGVGAKQLKDGGVSCVELFEVGFGRVELLCAGFEACEIDPNGIFPGDL